MHSAHRGEQLYVYFKKIWIWALKVNYSQISLTNIISKFRMSLWLVRSQLLIFLPKMVLHKGKDAKFHCLSKVGEFHTTVFSLGQHWSRATSKTATFWRAVKCLLSLQHSIFHRLKVVTSKRGHFHTP